MVLPQTTNFGQRNIHIFNAMTFSKYVNIFLLKLSNINNVYCVPIFITKIMIYKKRCKNSKFDFRRTILISPFFSRESLSFFQSILICCSNLKITEQIVKINCNSTSLLKILID